VTAGDINPDVAKHIVELVDGDSWALADYLAETFPVEEFGEPAAGVSNGLRAVLDTYQHTIKRQFGVEVKATTMRTYRATAIAWAKDERSSLASFNVHYRLRGPDHVEQLAKYEHMARREGSALSAHMLARYRSDENPKPPRSYEQRMRSAIANATRREMLGGLLTKREDWWTVVTELERSVAVRELRALAKRIEDGPIKAASDA
jgi:hypothetical protein